MSENREPYIVNTAAVPPDQRTKAVIIRALEAALKSTNITKERHEYEAVLLAMRATQTELPFW